jgi:hypothetical protein
MKFGEAITLLNAGHPVTRAGWNGKGMFLVRAGGYKVAAEDARPNGIITKEFLQGRGLTHLEILPHIDMWTAQNTYLAGWLASQSDMLADDWMVYVETPATFGPCSFASAPVKAEGEGISLMSIAHPTKKKPHWTQTAKGKKIMAARKRKGTK